MNLLKTKGLRSFSLFLYSILVAFMANANPCPKPLGTYKFDCDFCGCATTGGNFGFGTLGNTNFIGVRYSYQQFKSKDGIFENSPTSQEHFNTYQVWAKIPIASNFHITATVPYQDLNREFTDRTEQLNGLGDISLIGWYTLNFKKNQIQDEDADASRISMPVFTGHSLRFGMGIKLPTGEFEQVLTERVNPGFQLGTGSTDAIFSAGYSYSKNMFGINATGSYFLKGENRNAYRFGDQLSYNAKVFNGFLVGTNVLAPFVGLSGDFFQKIEQYGDQLPDTNGYMHLGTIGAELSLKRLVVGADIGIPLRQELFADDVKIKQRLLFYLNYTL
ncbi:hypothetical protein BUL40_08180 [Croceivirga radicis]|uniref:Transporter n=1 Tax=Croceivirga radicis TaxID=1929488 RepID=A0A1V6LSG8_9FLAO|nr:hypothetical protein [Croceivirga radicis]OQD43059.1 hypothetical protein BUL40_08180 [Croceivirga radicis]